MQKKIQIFKLSLKVRLELIKEVIYQKFYLKINEADDQYSLFHQNGPIALLLPNEGSHQYTLPSYVDISATTNIDPDDGLEFDAVAGLEQHDIALEHIEALGGVPNRYRRAAEQLIAARRRHWIDCGSRAAHTHRALRRPRARRIVFGAGDHGARIERLQKRQAGPEAERGDPIFGA